MNDTTRREDTRPRVLAGRSLDLKVAALAFAAFMIFMFLLTRWLFPEGMALSKQGTEQTPGGDENAVQREVSYSGEQRDGAVVAEVLATRRNVQIKGHDVLAWSTASKGALLANRDSLQTLRNSGATVQLDDDSVLQIGPDSLIVFQGNIPDPFTPARTNSIVMMAGTLDAQFASARNNPMNLEVALPNGLARFIAGDDDTAVAFNVNINPDLSSSVSVHAGTGILTVGGRSATVDAQHGITISATGEVIEQGRLPGQPRVTAPRNDAVFEYRALPPELAFSWQPVPRADRYRFRLARDRAMTDVVIDEHIAAPGFDYGGLGDGAWYWQVSAMNGLIEGPAAAAQAIRLVRDSAPPALRLEASELLSDSHTAVVRGSTDPGASVYVQGDPVALEAGRFERRIALDPGTNLIVVEAVDRAGNVAYDSQIINTNIAINGGGE